MATIAENLQFLLDQKQAIKEALTEKGKNPTDELKTYAGLINELENEEQITYVLTTSDSTDRARVIKSNEQSITLTAKCDDIRNGYTAITDTGFTEGVKDIPAYHTQAGQKIIQAGSAIAFDLDDYDFTKIQIVLIKYNTSITNSAEVYAATVENALYTAGTTTKIADVTKNDTTQTVNLGITAEEKTVLRYFIMREEN